MYDTHVKRALHIVERDVCQPKVDCVNQKRLTNLSKVKYINQKRPIRRLACKSEAQRYDTYVKRDLLMCQKKPISTKRDLRKRLTSISEALRYDTHVKRNLHIVKRDVTCPKRLTHMSKETCIENYF